MHIYSEVISSIKLINISISSHGYLGCVCVAGGRASEI